MVFRSDQSHSFRTGHSAFYLPKSAKCLVYSFVRYMHTANKHIGYHRARHCSWRSRGSNTTHATFLQFFNRMFLFFPRRTMTTMIYSSPYCHLFSENRCLKTSNIGTSFSRPCVYHRSSKSTKLGWRKFRRRISEFCYVGGIFTGHNTARSASLNSASVGRMKMLQRRKIGRDLA